MAGDFRLTVVQRTDQLADTQLTFTGDQQRGPGAGFVGKAFENGGGGEHDDVLSTYGCSNIRISICIGQGPNVALVPFFP